MPNQFVIVAYPRTGSYNLMSLLDSCEDVSCYGELFKADKLELSKFRKKKLPIKTVEERDADPAAFLRLLMRQTAKRHFGFKVFVDHLRALPAVEQIIRRPRWKKIVLRRNPVEIYASLLRARQTKIWTKRENRIVPEDVLNQPVRFDRLDFETFMTSYKLYVSSAEAIAAAGQSFFIDYSQIGEESVMTELLNFIGSQTPASALRSSYTKQFSGSIEDAFENWAEFRDYLDTRQAAGPETAP